MRYFPNLDDFRALARDASLVPVYRQLVGDTLTPVTAFGKIQEGDWSFLFESVVGGERVGRYSFLGSGPFRTVEAHGSRVRTRDGTGPWAESEAADPLRVLEEMVAAYRAPHLPGLPRFCGGAVGFAGYDTVRYVERLPDAPPDDRNLPDLSFGFYDRSQTGQLMSRATIDLQSVRFFLGYGLIFFALVVGAVFAICRAGRRN